MQVEEVKKEKFNFDLETLTSILPKKLRVVREDDVEAVNEILNRSESITEELILKNITTYTETLKEFPKVGLKQYFNAVTFLTNVNLGKTDADAYRATFPARTAQLIKEGRARDIGVYAHEYKTTKLVTRLIALTAVPSHIVFHTGVHKVLKTLMNIGMDEGERTRDRIDAMKAFLEHTKTPEIKNDQRVNINVNGNDAITQILGALSKSAEAQVQMLEAGQTNLHALGKQQFIDVVKEDVE